MYLQSNESKHQPVDPTEKGECIISFKPSVIQKATYTEYESSSSWNREEYLEFKIPFYRSFQLGLRNNNVSEVQYWGPLGLFDVNQIVCPCDAFKPMIGHPKLGRSGVKIGCNSRHYDQNTSSIFDLLKIEVVFGERNEDIMESLIMETENTFDLLQTQAIKDIDSYSKSKGQE